MSSRTTLPGRSTSSKPPPPPIQSDPTALVHPTASFTGTHPITIEPNAIIQLRTRISSAYGPLTIGEGTIISERVILTPHPTPSSSSSSSSSSSTTTIPNPPQHIHLGPGVSIESGAVVEAASVGAYSIIEIGAKVGKGVVLGEHCKICAGVEVGEGEVIADDVVVYGNGWGERRVEREGVGLRGLGGMRGGLVGGMGDTLRGVWTGK